MYYIKSTHILTKYVIYKIYVQTGGQIFFSFKQSSFICLFCFQIDLDSKEEVKLIDLESAKGSEHTVFIMPPDPTGMVEEAYT